MAGGSPSAAERQTASTTRGHSDGAPRLAPMEGLLAETRVTKIVDIAVENPWGILGFGFDM